MTKSEAKKWGTTVEAATNGQTVSQKVCGNGTGSNCGVNSGTTGSTNGNKISAVFSAEGAEAISSMDTTSNGTTINVSGMATNINGLSKEEKAVVAARWGLMRQQDLSRNH
ncbi:hypothetical protein [Anaplasma marginale]|uniref:hypothetical protein n=1 Tax=Anaplasma marginale TaxID=770 RepID=UPI0026CE4145